MKVFFKNLNEILEDLNVLADIENTKIAEGVLVMEESIIKAQNRFREDMNKLVLSEPSMMDYDAKLKELNSEFAAKNQDGTYLKNDKQELVYNDLPMFEKRFKEVQTEFPEAVETLEQSKSLKKELFMIPFDLKCTISVIPTDLNTIQLRVLRKYLSGVKL